MYHRPLTASSHPANGRSLPKPYVAPTDFFLAARPPHDPSDIIQSVDEGLTVTELVGSGVNLVTGDYSRGAVGFWIDKGELTYPIEAITMARTA